MSEDLPKYYVDCREHAPSPEAVYELVMLAGHSVTAEPLYILKSLDGYLNEAVPFDEIGKTWRYHGISN